MTINVKIEGKNPFKSMAAGMKSKGLTESRKELILIAEEMVRKVKGKIRGSDVPWGEGIDAGRANSQLADSVYYTIKGNNVIIGVEDGIHAATGLPYAKVAKMREIGTSQMEMNPAFTPAFRHIQINKKDYARRIGRRAARSMRT